MGILSDLVAFVQARSTITALIADRFQPGPNVDEPPVYPYTDYYLIGGNPELTFDRRAYRTARVQVDHVGAMSEITAVDGVFQEALEGYVGDFVSGGTHCKFIEQVGGITSPTGIIDPTKGPIHKLSNDYIIQYSDAN